jgi:hypothetical protein
MRFAHAVATAQETLHKYEPMLSLEEALQGFICKYSGLAAVLRLNSRPARHYPQSVLDHVHSTWYKTA